MRGKDIELRFWLGLSFYVALCAVLGTGPVLLSIKVHPWAGVAAAIAAIPIWMFLGPRPGPGFLEGTIASAGLLAFIGLAVVALIRAFL